MALSQTTPVNAAPMTIALGTDDKSTRAPVVTPEVLPTHLAHVWSYAQSGPTEPQLVDGAAAQVIYGADTFDPLKPYWTHQSELIKAILDKGSSVMFERVIPADAPPPANARLYLDVLGPVQIPNYARQPDGSYELDDNGDPVVGTPATVEGYKVKWVVAPITPVNGEDMFGKGTVINGDQTDAATGTQSKRYPIFDMAYPSQGALGNQVALRLYAPTEQSANSINTTSLVKDFVYPFRLQVLQKTTPTTTPTVKTTQSAAQFVDFCVKTGVVSSIDQSAFYVGKRIPSAYQRLDDPSGLPNDYGPIGRFYVYQKNIDTLIPQFFAAEKPFINEFSDFTTTDDDATQMYRFNFISGVSSQNVPYTGFILNTQDANAQRLTEGSLFYLSGGGDGTMDEELFADLVSASVKQYADPTSYLMNDAKYPQSVVYDSGFPLQTKYDLMSVLAIRKDMACIVSVHDVLGQQLTADEESSLAVALKTRMQLYPESDWFGTATMRGVIVGRSGMLLNSQYDKPLPLTIELAAKFADYMGAGNGIWKPGGGFDIAPLNQITMFKQSTINVTWTPATVRNKDWSNGLLWAEDFGRRAVYWPAFKTIYDNDTSVLTSIFTMFGIIECEKVGQRAQRQFSGTSQLTNLQLIKRTNDFVRANTSQPERFDGRFEIVPETYFTAADNARGYSWSLRIKMYANNQKTVLTTSIEAYRMEDYVAPTTA